MDPPRRPLDEKRVAGFHLGVVRRAEKHVLSPNQLEDPHVFDARHQASEVVAREPALVGNDDLGDEPAPVLALEELAQDLALRKHFVGEKKNKRAAEHEVAQSHRREFEHSKSVAARLFEKAVNEDVRAGSDERQRAPENCEVAERDHQL